MADTESATELAEMVHSRIDTMLADLDDQILVSQNRWVDHLLDLHSVCKNRQLRDVIETTLVAIRRRKAVEADHLREELLKLAVAVGVESAFDDAACLSC